MSFPPSKSFKPSPPLVMHHLMLLQGGQLTWIGRSAFARERNVWSGELKGSPAALSDPLSAAADLFERTPRGRIKIADKLTVLLGYPYVRHTVLPWQTGLARAADWQAYANAVFDEQDGSAYPGRQVVVDPAPSGQPRLAAATDAALIRGLQALAKTHQLRLVSCTSLLTAAVQRHWDMLEDDCVLSLPQHGALECLFRKQGTWQGVCGIAVAPGAALADSIAAAAQLARADSAGENAVPVLAVAPFSGSLRQGRDNSASVRWLAAAHPWLQGSQDYPDGFTRNHARGPAFAAPPGKPGVPAGRYKWGYWAADNLVAEQSGRYGAWGKLAWRQPLDCSAQGVAYAKPGLPFGPWQERRQ
ncbi:hypothetical protein [Collimonas fungivorans]|uniref:Uncharacterized protein n=1 Tax=Collimonas fungivorans (strain Ter331) TaxID=1005048 RepID=G0ADB5_COLFT|nr:hypothetical protein [Collimonas fungivorans]AEK63377.1 hypothetical protein CFU_3553 [Collimonas fungivorans Ter331]